MKPAQAHCCLHNDFVSCVVFVLYVGLSLVFTLPMLVWLTQGETITPPVDPLSCDIGH